MRANIISAVAHEIGQASDVHIPPETLGRLATVAVDTYEREKYEELQRLPLAGRGASVVDPKQEPSLDPHRRHPVLKLQKRVTFTEQDRRDQRLAALEAEYDKNPDYATIPTKEGGARHYMLVSELEAAARALLIRQTILELYPDAETNAIEFVPVLYPNRGGAAA